MADGFPRSAPGREEEKSGLGASGSSPEKKTGCLGVGLGFSGVGVLEGGTGDATPRPRPREEEGLKEEKEGRRGEDAWGPLP